MLGKIKALPERFAFAVGLTLILLSPILLLLMSFLIPLSNWLMMNIEGGVLLFAFLFILSAADKRHSRIGK